MNYKSHYTSVATLFENIGEAISAVEALVRCGFPRTDINLVASKAYYYYETLMSERSRDMASNMASNRHQQAADLGAATGFFTGLTVFPVPGCAIIALGPVVDALTDDPLGATNGGIVAALMKNGLTKEEAAVYHKAIREGWVLVILQTTDDWVDSACDIMQDYLASNMVVRTGEGVPMRDGEDAAEALGFPSISAGSTATEVKVHQEVPPFLASQYVPGMADAGALEREFREHYTRVYEKTGLPFDVYGQMYRYGRALSMAPTYAASTWAEIADKVRHAWYILNTGAPFDAYEDAIRFGWELGRARVV